MRVWQSAFAPPGAELSPQSADLVLVLGSVDIFDSPGFATRLTAAYPDAVTVGCSTAGEIAGDSVLNGACIVTAAASHGAMTVDAAAEMAAETAVETAGDRLALLTER
ncbi:FIST N-terminal domain-containing protein (plasmid) [Azospirillum melinis]|uniref:FIST N-terminal domain-containing protein n=1 Tax=Azospirillum melinis TaxID=328839 RepID=UPI003757C1E8